MFLRTRMFLISVIKAVSSRLINLLDSKDVIEKIANTIEAGYACEVPPDLELTGFVSRNDCKSDHKATKVSKFRGRDGMEITLPSSIESPDGKLEIRTITGIRDAQLQMIAKGQCHTKECQLCKGSGFNINKDVCPKCGGIGKVILGGPGPNEIPVCQIMDDCE